MWYACEETEFGLRRRARLSASWAPSWDSVPLVPPTLPPLDIRPVNPQGQQGQGPACGAKGAIVNVSSQGSLMALPEHATYCASSHPASPVPAQPSPAGLSQNEQKLWKERSIAVENVGCFRALPEKIWLNVPNRFFGGGFCLDLSPAGASTVLACSFFSASLLEPPGPQGIP